MLTPARRRGVEWLDDPAIDPAVRERSIDDVTRSNRWLGGLRAARREIGMSMLKLRASGERNVTLLDVGTGLADIPAAVTKDAQARGMTVAAIGVDEARSLLVNVRRRVAMAVCANGLTLPFRDRSIDVVTASQVLHHFPEQDAVQLLRELHRVARRDVIVSDLRRSWVAAAGFWFVSFPLRFHRVTRHDGVVSVLRGFTANELRQLVRTATGVQPIVRRHPGFRLTARWSVREVA